MRKRFLRLTTATAVLAIGLGYGMPAQAQLGGLLGGVLGGGQKSPEDTIKATADELSKARDLLGKQSKLIQTGQQALTKAQYLHEIADGLLYTQIRVEEDLAKGSLDLDKHVLNTQDLVRYSEKKTMAALIESRKAAKSAAEATSTQAIDSANVVAETDEARRQIDAAHKLAASKADDAGKIAASFAAQLSRKPDEAKGVFITKVYKPVIEVTATSKSISEVGVAEIEGRLIPLFDKIHQEAERDADNLLKAAVLSGASLALRGKDLSSAIDSLKTNPAGAQASLNKMNEMLGELKGIVQAFEDNRTNIKITQEAVDATRGHLEAVKAQFQAIEARSKGMPELIEKIRAGVTGGKTS